MDDDLLHGCRGLLAYDAGTDRMQCHACSDWYRMVLADHLKLHGLTVAAYKATEQGAIGRVAREARRREYALWRARRARLRRAGRPYPMPCLSYKAVHDRFGSWQHIRELMDRRDAGAERRDEGGG